MKTILAFFRWLFVSPDEDERRRAWCERYGKLPAVQKWLRENPPPAEWRGSPVEYAYLEMPLWYLDRER